MQFIKIRCLALLHGLSWLIWLKLRYPVWFHRTPRELADPKPWPNGFNPQNDPVFAHNEIVIEGVSPHEVLTTLLKISDWKRYYPNASDGTTVDAAGQIEVLNTLTLGKHYDWTTFGVNQSVHVTEIFDDGDTAALAWAGSSPGTRFYHRWILRRNGSGGTMVITEECQQGMLASLDSFLMSPGLHAAHELWLTRLKTWLLNYSAISD